jgi:hypothetical protein
MEKHEPKDEELLRFRTEAAQVLGVSEKPAGQTQEPQPPK